MDQYQNLSQLAQGFNWGEPSWSLFILLGWLAISVLYALASGRGRVLALLMSLYAAKLITLQVPLLTQSVATKLPIQTPSLQALVVFGAILMLLFFALSKYGFKTSAEGRGSALIFVTIFSTLQVGLLTSSVLNFLPTHVTNQFAPLIKQVFLSTGAEIFWLLAPLVFLIIFGRFVSSRLD